MDMLSGTNSNPSMPSSTSSMSSLMSNTNTAAPLSRDQTALQTQAQAPGVNINDIIAQLLQGRP